MTGSEEGNIVLGRGLRGRDAEVRLKARPRKGDLLLWKNCAVGWGRGKIQGPELKSPEDVKSQVPSMSICNPSVSMERCGVSLGTQETAILMYTVTKQGDPVSNRMGYRIRQLRLSSDLHM